MVQGSHLSGLTGSCWRMLAVGSCKCKIAVLSRDGLVHVMVMLELGMVGFKLIGVCLSVSSV